MNAAAITVTASIATRMNIFFLFSGDFSERNRDDNKRYGAVK
jgi:hypothetical protein